MRINTGDIAGMRKWANKDRDDNSFLGKFNQEVGGPILAIGAGIGAVIQISVIIKEIAKGFKR